MHRHFLVVATDGKVREALSADLRGMGCKVTLAANGIVQRYLLKCSCAWVGLSCDSSNRDLAI